MPRTSIGACCLRIAGCPAPPATPGTRKIPRLPTTRAQARTRLWGLDTLIGPLLGHALPGVSGVCIRHSYDAEMRAAPRAAGSRDRPTVGAACREGFGAGSG